MQKLVSILLNRCNVLKSVYFPAFIKKDSQPTERKANMTESNQTRLIRAKELAARLSVSTATVWNMANPKSRHYNPDFPKPIKVSANVTGWIESEISGYIQQCAAKREA